MKDINKYSESEINEKIFIHLKQAFGVEIQCSDKLLETLKYRTGEMTLLPPYGIWMSALKTYPILSQFLLNNGFEFDKIDWNYFPPIKKEYIIQDWYTTIFITFSFLFDDDNLSWQPGNNRSTRLFNGIKKRKRLHISDLLIGTLRDQKRFNSAIEFLYQGIYSGKNVWDNVQIPEDYLHTGTNKEHEKISRAFGKWLRWSDEISNKLENWRINIDTADDNSFLIYHDGSQIRLRPFSQFNINQIDEPNSTHIDGWYGRGNVFNGFNNKVDSELLILEDLINSNAKEIEFQKFFENYPKFLLLLGNYQKLHPHLILTEDGGSKLIPDFFLEKIDSDFCDILDLKRPMKYLIRNQKNRIRFRDCVMEAVAQVTHYRNWFDDRENRQLFYERYGLKSYRPKMVVVIGRNQNEFDNLTKIQLESSIPSWVNLTTYDTIINKVNQWKQFTNHYQ